MKTLQYYPFSSLIQANFWDILSQNKLDYYKLNAKEVKILASYRNDLSQGLPPLVSLDYQSFNLNSTQEVNSYDLYGTIFLFNTIEEFKTGDKNKLIQEVGEKMWKDIQNFEPNDSKQNLSKILSIFIFLVYLDLKHYKFYYWFAFPALSFFQFEPLSNEAVALIDVWPLELIKELVNKHSKLERHHKAYFLTTIDEKKQLVEVHPLCKYNQLMNADSFEIFLSLADPCTHRNYPGWPLRNFLAFAYFHFKKTKWNVLCYRLNKTSCATESIIINVDFNLNSSYSLKYLNCVGWEKNEKQKLAPRMVDLSSSFDPKVLSANAVNLNLKLIKWRLMPDLDLEKICSAKCLLLGAGTLGCNVARGLMGWGIKNITFVDSSKVSFSNPVRQSLFEFEDCLNSGKYKSEAAANKLTKIYPNINSKGYVMTIPMPGHAVFATSLNEVEKDIKLLENLIEEHDCVFLLMDTRESRWLPTVIGQLKQKIVINAALGFDTFLVQRHGIPNKNINELKKLGCYFCNDVVAPGDSTKNRTLDQQCTVTRPGVSMMAASLAVELLISVFQYDSELTHENKCQSYDSNEMEESSLGIIPHQIRGFLSNFNQIMPSTYAFDRCTACSPIILDAYKKNKLNFLIKVFQDSNYLEEVTGLKMLQEETNIDDVWALSDDES